LLTPHIGPSLSLARGANVTNCSKARAIVHSRVGYSGSLSCRKAEALARSVSSAQGSVSSAQRAARRDDLATPSTLPATIFPAPDDGMVYSPGDQTGETGAVVTAQWNDLESNMYVEVKSLYLTSDVSQGGIQILVLNPLGYDPATGVPQQAAEIDGYSGGIYLTPETIGALTLSSVAGSVTQASLSITFIYPGGTGTLDPFTNTFTMSPSPTDRAGSPHATS